jgi:hypothetical protein
MLTFLLVLAIGTADASKSHHDRFSDVLSYNNKPSSKDDSERRKRMQALTEELKREVNRLRQEDGLPPLFP